MEQRQVRILHEKEDVFEKFVEPEGGDQPLIRVRKETKEGLYSAVFSLELAGVTKIQAAEGGKVKRDSGEKAPPELHRETFIGNCLSEGQSMEIIYRCARDETGIPTFFWRIEGSAKGKTEQDAVNGAGQLWLNMKVALGASSGYIFAPVMTSERFMGKKQTRWTGVIRPSGVMLSTKARIPAGFAGHHEASRKTEGVIIVQYGEDGQKRELNSVVSGAAECPGEVTMVLSLSPCFLTEKDMEVLTDALKWLQNGERKQIGHRGGATEGIEDEAALKRLRETVGLWLRNPSGQRITCTVLSESPIPNAYLAMIGKDLFNCPFTVTVTKKERGELEESQSQNPEPNVLDLQDFLNAGVQQLALFPNTNLLLDHGVKRLFSQRNVPTSETGISLGVAGEGSALQKVRFARADRSRHTYMIGATGTGKSTLLYNMIVQDIENGEGVILLDPHGDLYTQVLGSIPKRRVDDVVLIDPCDFAHAVGINLLECSDGYRPVQMNFVVNEMIRIFHRLYDLTRTGGPMFEQYMRNALLLAIDNEFSGATLMDVPAIFEDERYREFLLKRCKSTMVTSFWRMQAEKAGGEAALSNMAPYVTSKLNQFTNNGLLRPLIGQARSTVNFRKSMDEGKIILVNLSKGFLGELDAQLLGMLIVGKIFSSAMARVTQKPGNRRPVFLYIDEFQNFTTDSVAFLLSEARKFGLNLTICNQNLAQLNAQGARQSVLDSVMANCGSIVMLRLGAIDSEKMEAYTKPELDARDLQELPDFTAAARIITSNTPTRPFVFRTLPAVDLSENTPTQEVIAQSRKRYTVPTEKVEEAIAMRRTRYSEMEKECRDIEEEWYDLVLKTVSPGNA